MQKISAFYLDKQKSFIPKKKLSVPCTMNSSYFSQKMATRRPNFPHPRLWVYVPDFELVKSGSEQLINLYLPV